MFLSGYIDSIFFLLSFEGAIDKFDALDDVEHRHLVLVFDVCSALIRVYLFGHRTCLVLNEVESVHHDLGGGPPVNTNSEHADNTTR